jgi:hypothetical protein
MKKYKELRVRPVKNDKAVQTAFPSGYIAEYINKNVGISWYIRFDDKLAPFLPDRSYEYGNPYYQSDPEPYSVRAKINPKILTGTRDYLTAANLQILDDVETRFNIEAERISRHLGTFQGYSMSRVDYCLNIDVGEMNLGCSAKQLLTLSKRGDIPKHYEEWMEDNIKQRRKTPNRDAFYLQSGSVTFNCYCKYGQLLSEYPNCPDLIKSCDLIRYEVQCKYPKVYAMSRPIDARRKGNILIDEYRSKYEYRSYNPTNPIKELLSDHTSASIMRKYLYKIIRKGDYFTLDGARWMVQSHNYRREKEERLMSALDLINESRGIAKARAKLGGKELKDFVRSLKDLDTIMVNPVTIPERWGIKHIPNPLRAYYSHVTEEQLESRVEFKYARLLDEYLS